MNKTSISETWHIINNAAAVITMDSGILHLAGTTETTILDLGSSIKPEFRIPYRINLVNHIYV
jgi:ADP-heptose:LPS heptosyltransferase